MASGKIQLKWVRSMICTPVKHRKVVKGLGFTRLNQVIERPDTAAIRGMVKKIPHLVEIVKSKLSASKLSAFQEETPIWVFLRPET